MNHSSEHLVLIHLPRPSLLINLSHIFSFYTHTQHTHAHMHTYTPSHMHTYTPSHMHALNNHTCTPSVLAGTVWSHHHQSSIYLVSSSMQLLSNHVRSKASGPMDAEHQVGIKREWKACVSVNVHVYACVCICMHVSVVYLGWQKVLMVPLVVMNMCTGGEILRESPWCHNLISFLSEHCVLFREVFGALGGAKGACGVISHPSQLLPILQSLWGCLWRHTAHFTRHSQSTTLTLHHGLRAQKGCIPNTCSLCVLCCNIFWSDLSSNYAIFLPLPFSSSPPSLFVHPLPPSSFLLPPPSSSSSPPLWELYVLCG